MLIFLACIKWVWVFSPIFNLFYTLTFFYLDKGVTNQVLLRSQGTLDTCFKAYLHHPHRKSCYLLGLLLGHTKHVCRGELCCVCRDQMQCPMSQLCGIAYNKEGGEGKGATTNSFYCDDNHTTAGMGNQTWNIINVLRSHSHIWILNMWFQGRGEENELEILA